MARPAASEATAPTLAVERTVREIVRGLGDAVDGIDREPLATVRPRAHGAYESWDPHRSGLVQAGELLRHETTLGEGGMAVVRLATQLALGRKVAVKEIHPERRADSDAVRSLVLEARVTGGLEHPNVVPVHTLAVGEGGAPCIVLKRIEGVSWDGLLADEEALRARFPVRDALEWHLRVFMQVCNAVHFAHAKGVVHRDLKPQNVMIGAFGEVYVLDWGLAVSVRDEASADLGCPPASSVRGLSGTPGYIAPEMIAFDEAPISERTDVYLLGAILHHVATGRAPHQGKHLTDLLRHALVGHIELGPEVPPALAKILRRALARAPSERFESAEALRLAVDEFLARRGAELLVVEAEGRLAELRRHVGSVAPGAEARARLYDRFGECRFGFQEALRRWPDDERALAGLRGAVATMAEFELAAGAPEAADALLAGHADALPELRDRVKAALAARAVERDKLEELEALRRDNDPSIGRRTRVFVFGLLASVWIVLPLCAALYGYLRPEAELPMRPDLWSIGHLLAAAALIIWARDSLSKTTLNRRAAQTVLFILLLNVILHFALRAANAPVAITTSISFFLWAVGAGMFALAAEPCFWPSAAGYLVAFLVSLALPEQRMVWSAAANAVLLVNALSSWGPWPTRTRAGRP